GDTSAVTASGLAANRGHMSFAATSTRVPCPDDAARPGESHQLSIVDFIGWPRFVRESQERTGRPPGLMRHRAQLAGMDGEADGLADQLSERIRRVDDGQCDVGPRTVAALVGQDGAEPGED